MITVDDLRRVPLFHDLPDDEARAVASRLADIHLRAGDWLIHEGEQPSFFLLLEGSLELFKMVHGIERRLDEYGPGVYFGEVPLLLGSPAIASLRAKEPAWFALGAACGFAIAYGAWGHALWTHFGNPVFPYANEWFRSPWWEAQAVAGRDFGPDTIAGFLAFPFAMWDPPMFLVAEVPYRDGRMALVWALALAAAVAWLWRRARGKRYARTSGAWRLVAWFYAASFAAWTIAFSIYRYLLPLDALAGLAIGGLLLALLPQRIAVAALVACTVALVATTRTADWGRVPFDERWFEAKSMPIVEPDGLVLITTGEAVSYYIPMLPASSRYVGVLNTLVKPDQASGLAQKARELVRDHKGYVYQMTHPLTAGEEVLGPLGLERTSACAIVVTNMPVSPIEFCLLVRKEAAP